MEAKQIEVTSKVEKQVGRELELEPQSSYLSPNPLLHTVIIQGRALNNRLPETLSTLCLPKDKSFSESAHVFGEGHSALCCKDRVCYRTCKVCSVHPECCPVSMSRQIKCYHTLRCHSNS